MAGRDVAVRVEGLRELRRELRKAGPEGRKAVTRAARTAGRIVRDEARSDAPKRSGRLAKSVKNTASQSRATVTAGGAKAPHAGPVNFGWPARSMSAALAGSSSPYWAAVGRKGVRGIKATHFLEDAVSARWDDVARTYEEEVRRVIAALASGSNPLT